MITIDYETYYAKDYTLSKMTVEEYVRDPRFEIIGVSIKRDDQKGVWYPRDEVQDALDHHKLHEEEVLAHNAMFDGFILNEVNGIRPGFWLDTLSMARPLHMATVGNSLAKLAKHYKLPDKGDEIVAALGMRYDDFTDWQLEAYGRYCCHDGWLAHALFHTFMGAGFPKTELVSIDQTIRMFTEPMIELDRMLLEQHLLAERARKEEILHTVLGGAPTEEKLTELRSNQQFASKLKELGVSPPLKISKTTGKATYAFAKTDEGMQALLEDPSDAVSMLVRARLGVKSSIEETRAERFIGVSERGPLPVDLNFYGAHTGRLSAGSKMNIQNLPVRSGSNNLRNSLLAPEGYVFVSADSSQIEARLLAWLAGQNDLTKAFAEGRDVYCEFAGEVYGKTVTKKDKDERFVGKTGILSLGYGAGGPRFRDMLRTQGGVIIHEKAAYNIVDLYRERYPHIPKLWRRATTMLQTMMEGGEGRLRDLLDYDQHGIMLPSGFRIQYPGLSTDYKGEMHYLNDPRQVLAYKKARVSGRQEDMDAIKWTKIYGGKAVENIVQALAAIVIRRQARTMYRKGHKMVFQVHDDLVFLTQEKDAPACAYDLHTAMHKTPKWAEGVPLACELKIGRRYGSMEVVA
jgi:DNA polymerase